MSKSWDGRKSVYVAGPMRGRVGWNFGAFDLAAAAWEGAGWHAYNPAAVARALGYGPDGWSGEEPRHVRHVMLSDVACLYASDAIALLPGWECSRGVAVELALAQFLGLTVYDAVTMERIEPKLRPWS